MSELPPLILAVQPRERGKATLVAARAEDGTITAGMEAWPRPVPRESLFVYWPAKFTWSAGAARFLEAVRERGGASFPLGVGASAPGNGGAAHGRRSLRARWRRISMRSRIRSSSAAR